MPFSGMIKLKLKFSKSMQNKIAKKYRFYFSFILFFFFKRKKIIDGTIINAMIKKSTFLSKTFLDILIVHDTVHF